MPQILPITSLEYEKISLVKYYEINIFTTIVTNLAIGLANLTLSSPNNSEHINVSHNAFFSSCYEKTPSFLVLIMCVKNNYPVIELRFSLIFSLIGNNTVHHSGQNLSWTHSVAPRESTKF